MEDEGAQWSSGGPYNSGKDLIPLLVTDKYDPSTALSFTSLPCMITMVYYLPSYSNRT